MTHNCAGVDLAPVGGDHRIVITGLLEGLANPGGGGVGVVLALSQFPLQLPQRAARNNH